MYEASGYSMTRLPVEALPSLTSSRKTPARLRLFPRLYTRVCRIVSGRALFSAEFEASRHPREARLDFAIASNGYTRWRRVRAEVDVAYQHVASNSGRFSSDTRS
jgi:hypothetical protein